MPFGYYDRLGPARQRSIARATAFGASDAGRRGVDAPCDGDRPVLASARRGDVEAACQALVDAIDAQLAVPAVRVRVLERRPADSGGELQGLYEPDEITGGRARISVWMRTAQRVQEVKFRTFLRTLVHEVCHHLDYEHFRLAETFHTEGFYARESALVRELLGETARPTSPA